MILHLLRSTSLCFCSSAPSLGHSLYNRGYFLINRDIKCGQQISFNSKKQNKTLFSSECSETNFEKNTLTQNMVIHYKVKDSNLLVVGTCVLILILLVCNV